MGHQFMKVFILRFCLIFLIPPAIICEFFENGIKGVRLFISHEIPVTWKGLDKKD